MTTEPDYPGHYIIQNDEYETANVYGKILIDVPQSIFSHFTFYIATARKVISTKSSEFAFAIPCIHSNEYSRCFSHFHYFI